MTNTYHQVCILLGSNIQPESNLPQAIVLLSQRLILTRISSIWETQAVGSSGPNFLNAALLAYTQHHPARLKKEVLRPLEAGMGRIRTGDKNAARTIDLDVVVFDGHIIDRNLWRYAYAAVPVAELLPEIEQPGQNILLSEAARKLAGKTSIWHRSDLNLPVVFSLFSGDRVRERIANNSYLAL